MSSNFTPASVLDALRSVVPTGSAPLHEPHFQGNEWAYVKECLDTGWVSSVGKFVDRFEHDIAEFTGARYAIAVVNGTAALHICLKLAGVESGDEVVMQSLTFVATANAVSYCDAVPHFVDVEENSLGIDPEALSEHLGNISEFRGDACYNRLTGRRIRALLPMHTFGHPSNLDALLEVAKRFHLEFIEDAAESLGSYYRDRHTGNFGRLAAFSFNGNKIITTGGGGAIVTNDEVLAKLAKHITTTAKLPHRWRFDHDMVGFNYRMPNINAALGCAQIEQLPEFLAAKRQLFAHYREAFSGIEGIRVFGEQEDCRSNYWLQTLLLDNEHASMHSSLLEASNNNGLMTRPAWTPLHRLRPYAECPRMELPVTSSLEKRIINIPSSPQLVAISR
ncbi:LegC family aminotransferase [Dechloromonas sp. TW-R-39-2]|uniref:LegC family aminotransferase n=1 Tax=Dechloromonas sp. TW-R-39-2 TaxID=2654218 RepID=UPI00193C926A|nr:LegC family aminotransferase [Dechloromonas sp. TW-R-39-2]QRM20162.1 LegC family aminotransferase [Dechloromonas sp. TW-R-39-2]